METKICTKCLIDKPFVEFDKSNRNKDGKVSHCKLCEKKRKSEYYLLNKARINKTNQNWRDNNPHKVKEQHTNYYKDNKERLDMEHKIYNETHKEESCVYKKNYRKNNKEKTNNKANNRRKNDKLYYLTCLIRTVIRISIKKGKYIKKPRTTSILGCGFDFLKKHIEKQWGLPHNLDENGNIWMCWGNHGLYNGSEGYGWDIDHIVPLLPSKRNEEELLELCRYTNLQPLCSHINRDIKRDSLDYVNPS